MIEPLSLLFLIPLIFLAGFIDSIAGGGGLVSLTAYFAAGLSGPVALGNNKFSSTFGALISVWNYGRNGSILWSIAGVSAVFTIIGSHIGAELALLYSDKVLSTVLLIALPVLTVLVLIPRKERSSLILPRSAVFVLASILSFLTGLYDGFFGPGTGMFLTIGFSFMGIPLLKSAGMTKVVNASSNISALVTFIISGSVIYWIGIPCALSSIAGNALGSRFAIRHGAKAIKPLLVVVIIMLYIDIIVSRLA